MEHINFAKKNLESWLKTLRIIKDEIYSLDIVFNEEFNYAPDPLKYINILIKNTEKCINDLYNSKIISKRG
jgi:hypothetical protein